MTVEWMTYFLLPHHIHHPSRIQSKVWGVTASISFKGSFCVRLYGHPKLVREYFAKLRLAKDKRIHC